MGTVLQTIQRLRNHGVMNEVGIISLRALNTRFRPSPAGLVRSLLYQMVSALPQPTALEPLYKASMPQPQQLQQYNSDSSHIDLSNAHLDPYDLADAANKNNALFDKRAAAAICGGLKTSNEVPVYPTAGQNIGLLELKNYADEAPEIYIPTEKNLAALAFPDFFPGAQSGYLRTFVSRAIMLSHPGWCGSLGPGVNTWWQAAGLLAGDKWYDVLGDHDPFEGNYDMSQMHLLPMAYRYFHVLTPEARELLIVELLAKGRIHRPNCDDTFTRGGTPKDYSRAGIFFPFLISIGSVGEKRIGETENHILTILTARYLTNQLLYQRDHNENHDNRRNGGEFHGPYTTEIILILLRNILRDDFSEYNAKNYQTETRSALLNLCSYAYDHEVRLAARMVLDYISARIAVSSNDLRRMVPFRRRNEGKNVSQMPKEFLGYMSVGLLESTIGADPSTQPFAMLAGNLRAYEQTSPIRTIPWSIKTDGTDGNNAVMNVLSDYRLPPPVHDLFVNDLHRRFFQRLHRTTQDDTDETARNCDNMEIYAGSPSYLISAGGSPAKYAIDPYFALIPMGKIRQQKGVAMTTSFMPTGQSAGPNTGLVADDLIQFSGFSEDFDDPAKVENYGVAPDFACGHRAWLPRWCRLALVNASDRKFSFVNKKGDPGKPGFYLSLLRDRGFTILEAFDTWLHPELSFAAFMKGVLERNSALSQTGLRNNIEQEYTTQNGNRIRFKIWNYGEKFGAEVVHIDYGQIDTADSFGDAGNIKDHFLHGTVLNSGAEGVIQITNVFLGQTILLDMSDPSHPRRQSETGEIEIAGFDNEVWVNFEWKGKQEGDFYHPFNTVAEAVNRVADGGIIRIMPGKTNERLIIRTSKRIKIKAQIGGVVIGKR